MFPRCRLQARRDAHHRHSTDVMTATSHSGRLKDHALPMPISSRLFRDNLKSMVLSWISPERASVARKRYRASRKLSSPFIWLARLAGPILETVKRTEGRLVGTTHYIAFCPSIFRAPAQIPQRLWGRTTVSTEEFVANTRGAARVRGNTMH